MLVVIMCQSQDYYTDNVNGRTFYGSVGNLEKGQKNLYEWKWNVIEKCRAAKKNRKVDHVEYLKFMAIQPKYIVSIVIYKFY